MPFFKTMNIAGKLRAGFALMLLLLVGTALFAYSRLAAVQHESREMSSNWAPGVRYVSAININLLELRVAFLQFINGTPETRAAALASMSTAKDALSKSDVLFKALISSEGESKQHDAFMAQFGHYTGLLDKAIALVKDDKLEEARAVQRSEAVPSFLESAKLLAVLLKIKVDGADQSAVTSEAAYKSAVLWLIVVALLATAVAVVLAMTLAQAIVTPLQQAVSAADRVAEGDLSQSITFSGKDEIAHLLESMQKMQQSLVNTVGTVRSGSDSVATASAEIAQGNADLSSRTEEQASSLEETSATMEQLTSTVRQNADNAAAANQLAQSATQVARDGGQAVGEVVTTMQGIETSSKRIADIIGVIDGIAFQTNILALNAAVEAARAGEQGRGFAVVASEVRNLAQRSAGAAKEIKQLINDSVERVQSGTHQVDRAGQTIQNIVTSVQKLADIVGEISSATREQSLGISQVGEAVTQLDRATQQNAALVEQSAAASESLKMQAQALLGAVAGFKLDARAPTPVRHAAPAKKAMAARATPVARPTPTAAGAAMTRQALAAPKPLAKAAPRPTPTGSTAKPAAARTPPSPRPPPPAAEADGEWSSF